MKTRLTYVIKYVGESEFATGDVTLALHTASETNRPGSVELGYGVGDLRSVYNERAKLGLKFVSEPAPAHGTLLATFLDSENASCRISG